MPILENVIIDKKCVVLFSCHGVNWGKRFHSANGLAHWNKHSGQWLEPPVAKCVIKTWWSLCKVKPRPYKHTRHFPHIPRNARTSYFPMEWCCFVGSGTWEANVTGCLLLPFKIQSLPRNTSVVVQITKESIKDHLPNKNDWSNRIILNKKFLSKAYFCINTFPSKKQNIQHETRTINPLKLFVCLMLTVTWDQGQNIHTVIGSGPGFI